MIAKVKSYPFDFVSAEIDGLIELFNSQNNEAIVTKMKKIVPEFLSKNSEYERLDKELSN